MLVDQQISSQKTKTGPPLREQICGVIVSYMPDHDLLSAYKSLKSQTAKVIVVDNGSATECHEVLREVESIGAQILRLPENMGIATALNVGVQEARKQAYSWVLTLDQDTICEPDMIEKMREAYAADAAREKIAILAAVHFDRASGHTSKELRELKEPAEDREIVMTSGNLIPIHIFDKVGPFEDDLFIEYVDNEFCLRLRRYGLRVVLVRDARMGHQLGDTRKHHVGKKIWFFSHNYKPIRRYYRARNRLILYRRYKSAWVLRDIVFFAKDMAKILLVETGKWEKFKATWLGTLDAVLHRLGRAEGATLSTPKAPHYFEEFRSEIVPLLPTHSARVLDIGCGSGSTSAQLKRMGIFGHVTGIEGNPAVADEARRNLDEVITGDLDHLQLQLADGTFDTVIALDILEHLVDPWKMLRKLNDLLKPGGHLVVSIPNVRHFSVLFPLLFLGDWRYQQADILDSTHLRFFTRKTTLEILQQSGFEIAKVDQNGGKAGVGRLLTLMSFGLLKEFVIFQNLVTCRKRLREEQNQ